MILASFAVTMVNAYRDCGDVTLMSTAKTLQMNVSVVLYNVIIIIIIIIYIFITPEGSTT